MPESMTAKALRAISENRVRVLKATDNGIVLAVVSSAPDPATLRRTTYRTAIWIQDGHLTQRCTCPAQKRCYHLEVAVLLWEPGPHEISNR